MKVDLEFQPSLQHTDHTEQNLHSHWLQSPTWKSMVGPNEHKRENLLWMSTHWANESHNFLPQSWRSCWLLQPVNISSGQVNQPESQNPQPSGIFCTSGTCPYNANIKAGLASLWWFNIWNWESNLRIRGVWTPQADKEGSHYKDARCVFRLAHFQTCK